MLSLKSRTKSIQHFPSEGVVEKVFVAPVPWISMEDITWLACAQFQKETTKSQLSLHLWWCLFLKTWWQIWVTSTLNTSRSIHFWRERQKRQKGRRNTCNQWRRESYLMASMNASSALAASQHAHRTGGTHRTTWDQQFSCSRTDGLSTQEMSTLMKGLRRSVVTWNWESATRLDSVHLHAQKD